MSNNVRLIAITQPLIQLNDDIVQSRLMSPDEFIAYTARVSNPSNQNNNLTAEKLVKYLAKNKHWSPFEMIDAVMEINTTRDIARQILRHRSFSFQEFSQRYADPTKDMGFVTREARLQDKKNRQNSIETSDEVLESQWNEKQNQVMTAAQDAYRWAIENGVAKEQSRVVLPEGLTMSRLYMKGSIRSWIHYCGIRMGKATQKEHREIATDCWYKLIKVLPSIRESITIED